MEIDLERHDPRSEAFRAQVCVVGGGIAGITLAHALSQRGIEVALLEAGGPGIEARSQSLFAEARLEGQPHVGTREGRFRAWGGSSLRWGGQLLRMPTEPGPDWPVTAEELAPYEAEAERMLGADALPFGAVEFFSAVKLRQPRLLAELGELQTSLSKWTPFSRRNLAHTLGSEVLEHPWARVYLHAQATEILLAEDGTQVAAVLVRNLAGDAFRFEAEHFVVAAGTVETSRLLLASRSVVKQGVGNFCGAVGRNFHDHLTLPMAVMTGAARRRLLEELRPWVFGETLHSVKLEASAGLRERLGLNPVLAHLTLEEPEGSGVAVVREVLKASQNGGRWETLREHAREIPGATMEAARLAWAAKVGHRRFVSENAVVKLQLNLAQDAPSLSRIRLSEEQDAFGVPQVELDWRVTVNEMATARRFAGWLKERFEALGLEGVEWVDGIFAEGTALPGLDDARHAMGGACMGNDVTSSVVDAELTVHGVGNLSIASAGVFPSGSPQLPTLPLMALTLRLAERIAARLDAAAEVEASL
jgi:choline dehydrogenase-like flavoprotein